MKHLVAGAAVALLGLLVQPTAAVSADEASEDAAIVRVIEERLERNPITENYELEVDAENGVVTLHGRVTAAFERERAQELAATVDGVREVRNEIVVGRDPGDNLAPVGGGNQGVQPPRAPGAGTAP